MLTISILDCNIHPFPNTLTPDSDIRLIVKAAENVFNIASRKSIVHGVIPFNQQILIPEGSVSFEVVCTSKEGLNESFGHCTCSTKTLEFSRILSLTGSKVSSVSLSLSLKKNSSSLSANYVGTPPKVFEGSVNVSTAGKSKEHIHQHQRSVLVKDVKDSSNAKVRNTTMKVGYVHSSWPDPKAYEQDKLLYKIHLAEERKLESLRKITETSRIRNQEAAMRAERKKISDQMQLVADNKLRKVLAAKENEVRRLQREVSKYRVFGNESLSANVSVNHEVKKTPAGHTSVRAATSKKMALKNKFGGKVLTAKRVEKPIIEHVKPVPLVPSIDTRPRNSTPLRAVSIPPHKPVDEVVSPHDSFDPSSVKRPTIPACASFRSRSGIYGTGREVFGLKEDLIVQTSRSKQRHHRKPTQSTSVVYTSSNTVKRSTSAPPVKSRARPPKISSQEEKLSSYLNIIDTMKKEIARDNLRTNKQLSAVSHSSKPTRLAAKKSPKKTVENLPDDGSRSVLDDRSHSTMGTTGTDEFSRTLLRATRSHAKQYPHTWIEGKDPRDGYYHGRHAALFQDLLDNDEELLENISTVYNRKDARTYLRTLEQMDSAPISNEFFSSDELRNYYATASAPALVERHDHNIQEQAVEDIVIAEKSIQAQEDVSPNVVASTAVSVSSTGSVHNGDHESDNSMNESSFVRTKPVSTVGLEKDGIGFPGNHQSSPPRSGSNSLRSSKDSVVHRPPISVSSPSKSPAEKFSRNAASPKAESKSHKEESISTEHGKRTSKRGGALDPRIVDTDESMSSQIGIMLSSLDSRINKIRERTMENSELFADAISGTDSEEDNDAMEEKDAESSYESDVAETW